MSLFNPKLDRIIQAENRIIAKSEYKEFRKKLESINQDILKHTQCESKYLFWRYTISPNTKIYYCPKCKHFRPLKDMKLTHNSSVKLLNEPKD